MAIRRTSLILPCRRLDDFPTHLTGDTAAELLVAWTVPWHPSLLAATGELPRWHPADEPPEPSSLDGELVLMPSVSRQRIASDWCERVRATAPINPPPLEVVSSRSQTMDCVLKSADVLPDGVAVDSAGDFLALGYAYLQVELLTRAMRYSTVLDTEQFTNAAVAAARAAVSGDKQTIEAELHRAFDLLADARNHVYSVDFYIVDVTLLASTTLGESLRAKLARATPTNLLITGELIEQMSRDEPRTLAALKHAVTNGPAAVVGGTYRAGLAAIQSPESLLAEINRGQQAVESQLGQACAVFGQFESSFSTLLPEVLRGCGFQGALHTGFDGRQLARSEQPKTNWGPSMDTSIQSLATTPLDASRPETWLKFGQRMADSIAHDHVATIVLAGWPGAESAFYDDVRRAGRYNGVLGKIVTLDEYFRTTREADDWITFNPREYSGRPSAELGANPISVRVDAYRRDVLDIHARLSTGLMSAAGLRACGSASEKDSNGIVINPWNLTGPQYVGIDPMAFESAASPTARMESSPAFVPNVPGCGFAAIGTSPAPSPTALADGFTLRNEHFEVTVGKATGGIQSLRTHADRSTRVSQRLVFESSLGYRPHDEAPSLDTQMVADRVDITRSDSVLGEITSGGRLLDAAGQLLARFTQIVRVARGMPAILVDVELVPERLPEGDVWRSYFASRLATSSDAVVVRRGVQWQAVETTRGSIESSEWIELDDGFGTVTCYALGLPFHRRAATTWLDTLFLVAGEERRRFQFAIGLDQKQPTKTALALLTAGRPHTAQMETQPATAAGWFLHVGAANLLITHVEPLGSPTTGIRLRLLETDGLETRTKLAAFRPFQSARITDFRGNSTGVLSVVDGAAEIDLGPYRWIQIEADW